MPMSRKPSRRVVRRRKAVRRKRIGGTGSKKIEKVYSYTMTPNQAYIMSNSTAGGVSVSPDAAPLSNVYITTPALSKTGFTGYYDFGVSMAFQLNDLKNYLAFTGIYDNYKITSVNLELEFMSNTANVAGSAVLPTVYAVQDQDDYGTPQKISDVSGIQGHKRFKFGDKARTCFRIAIKPRLAGAVYNSTTTGQVGYQQTNGWQDCNYPSNQYYGLKLWFTDVLLAGLDNVNTAFRWKWTYKVSFKGAHNEF